MRFLLAAVLSLMVSSLALAETPPLDGGSSREQILDALNARGQGLKDFVADVSLAQTDSLSGDVTTLIGKVAYQAKGEGDARMRIVFDKKLFGDKPQAGAKVEYMLDKGWLNDRGYKRNIEIQRQVLKPGEKIDMLKLRERPLLLLTAHQREAVMMMYQLRKLDIQQS